jgi:hypothetical protein
MFWLLLNFDSGSFNDGAPTLVFRVHEIAEAFRIAQVRRQA